jgi:alkaline phosphatase D
LKPDPFHIDYDPAVSLTRRRFLWVATASGLAWPVLASGRSDGSQLFRHGVASGDPRTDGVILWTRVTSAASGPLVPSIEVRWRIATEPTLTRIVQSGTTAATVERDFCVKIDARGLEPGTTYYYAFESAGGRSPIGRTKTLPVGAVQRLRLAVLSCANYPAGFFNVYRMVANRPDLDAVIHLGDYIYEFANGEYGDGAALKRLPQPLAEAVALDDYRQRYACYRIDPDLQEAHRQHPFIAVWDDHELANDAWSGGAANHQPEKGEGTWAARQAAAWQAYSEWMPIREQSEDRSAASSPERSIRLYRAFRFGDLADLVMLDTRSMRDKQIAPDDVAGQNDVSRHVMGSAQEAWFRDTLRASQQAGIRWRLIGQQVLFSRLAPAGRPIQFTDIWDGYQADRERVLDFFERERIRNLVILTGDLHSSWALDVPRNPWVSYRSRGGDGSLAVELVTPAVSSPGLFAPGEAAGLAAALRIALPSLKFFDGQQRGYVLLDVAPQRLQADWYHATTVAERSIEQRLAASFVCDSGTAHLVPA